MNEKQIRRHMGEHTLALMTLQKRLDENQSRKRLACGFCGKRHQVSKLTLIQVHRYVEPYGCTGGDYWKLGEKQYECPSCGLRMRDPGDNDYLAQSSQFDRRIGELARYFGETVNEHRR